MYNTLLDHQKTMIKNLSSDERLFEKELLKSLNWLDQNEKQQFCKWVFENYCSKYAHIINRVFKSDSRTKHARCQNTLSDLENSSVI
ncbi:MAG: hypothetical protein ACEPOW_06990 [Bacteroidales bacterium]